MDKDQLIKALQEADSEESLEKASDACIAFFKEANDEDQQYIRTAMRKVTELLLHTAKQSRDAAASLIAEFDSRQFVTDKQ